MVWLCCSTRSAVFGWKIDGGRDFRQKDVQALLLRFEDHQKIWNLTINLVPKPYTLTFIQKRNPFLQTFNMCRKLSTWTGALLAKLRS